MDTGPGREQIAQWMARTARDLEIAQSVSDQGFHDACAYYCEQSVEKHLKAL